MKTRTNGSSGGPTNKSLSDRAPTMRPTNGNLAEIRPTATTDASTACDGDDDEDPANISLPLAERKERPRSRSRSKSKSARKRKRCASTSSTDEELIDVATEQSLQQSAMRNNLTHENVKSIIQKLVRNDHVLAHVKLKEEEELKEEQMRKTFCDTDELKMTRAKAKALNKPPLPLVPIANLVPDSEVVQLWDGELPSDDEDEEYQPGEDEFETDDDHNTTTSDVESQPRTPQTPKCHADHDDEKSTQYTADGLFKIPSAPHDQHAAQMEQENLVAQRTRSKVSMEQIPIEQIELNFIPPDVTSDLYDEWTWTEPEYAEFLSTLNLPMTNTTDPNVELDDEKTDPTFQPILDLPDLVDPEEHQDVPISRKEWKGLEKDISEIIDNTEMDKYLYGMSVSSALNTPTKELEEPIRSPEPTLAQFDPQTMSTPTVTRNEDATITTMATSTTYECSTVMPTPVNTALSWPINAMTFSPMKEASSVVLVQAAMPNGLPILLAVPGYQATIPPIATPTPTADVSVVDVVDSPIVQPVAIPVSAPPKKCPVWPREVAYLEHLDPNSIVTPTYPVNAVGFQPQQFELMQQQLRMHVQLTTQGFMQTHGHPMLHSKAATFRKFLTDIENAVTTHKTKVLHVANLPWARTTIDEWEQEMTEASPENKEMIEFIKEQWGKRQAGIQARRLLPMEFTEKLAQRMSQSRALIYPSLLPSQPFFDHGKPSKKFTFAEEFYIARGLDYYSRELPRIRAEQFGKSAQPVAMIDICKKIASDLQYIRTAESIYECVRFRQRSKIPSPIKYFLIHRKVPPLPFSTIVPFDEQPPDKQLLTELPTFWANVVQKALSKKQDELTKLCEGAVSKSPATSNRCKSTVAATESHTDIEPVQVQLLYIGVDNDQLNYKYSIELANENNSNNNNRCDRKNNDNNNNGSHEPLERGQTLLTSYFTSKKAKPLTTAVDNNNSDYQIDEIEVVAADEIHSHDCPKTATAPVIAQQHDDNLIAKWATIRYNLRQQPTTKLAVHTNGLVKLLALCFDFNVFYTSDTIGQDVTMRKATVRSSSSNSGSIDCDTGTAAVTGATMVGGSGENATVTSATVTTNAGDRRSMRGHKAADSVRMMFLNESKEDIFEKDAHFAQQYFEKVQETFTTTNETDKYSQFLYILRSFDQENDTAGDLYLKMEDLFLPKHPELASMFLNFLQPSDALRIGKFMEHFLSNNMTAFMDKLNSFFNKQPAQMKKILKCLEELSEEDNLTIERMKSKLLPLLKGNQLLINWFLECIDSPMADGTSAAGDFETLTCRKAADSTVDDDDMYEYIPQSDIQPDPIESPCSVRYINGSIGFGTRTFSTAKLSFTVNSAERNPIITTNGGSNGDRKQTDTTGSGSPNKYRCVHVIKQFGDAQSRDANRNVETPMDENEDSDDENAEPNHETRTTTAVDAPEATAAATAATTATEQMCDDVLLKAHGIRLNPAVHSSMVLNNNDMLNMLKSSFDRVTDADRDIKLSPKKQLLQKCATLTQRRMSPNAKKAFAQTRSPTNANKRPSTQPPLPIDSPAIQTAKRLKRFIENGTEDEVTKPTLTKANETTSSIESGTSTAASAMDYSENDDKSSTETDSDDADDSMDNDDRSPNVDLTKEPDKPAIVWTREADRLLLEQIKSGVNSNTEVIERISNRFPDRTVADVEARIEFLLDFLNKLQNRS